MSDANPKNPQAVPFLTEDGDGKFTVSLEAISVLEKVKAPLAVVSVAGMWRTGKSFLLNSLLGLNGKTDSFVVGNTVNACTKGLWLWGEPVTLDDGLTVLFVDSEGLGSTSRTQTEDCQIFSLAILLSSFFIWNSRGVIDGNALEDFALVVNLTKHIHIRSTAGKGEGSTHLANVNINQHMGTGHELSTLAEHFPSFLWVVRDFTLRLERNGREIDDRQYLDEALKPQKDVQKNGSSRNEIRKLLTTFFKSRDCLTLVRPAEDEAMLRNLSAQPLESLRPEFVKRLKILKTKVFGALRPKILNGRLMSGAMLATLAQTYAEALNSGGVPTISTAWDRVLENQASESVARAAELYEEYTSKRFGMDGTMLTRICKALPDHLTGGDSSTISVELDPANCSLPLETTELDAVHVEAKQAAVHLFEGPIPYLYMYFSIPALLTNSAVRLGFCLHVINCLKESVWGRNVVETTASSISVANNRRLNKELTAKRIAYRNVNVVYSRVMCEKLVKKLFAEIMDFDKVDDDILDSRKEEFDAEHTTKEPVTCGPDDMHALFCSKYAYMEKRYNESAVGPAKAEVFAKLLVTKVVPILSDLMTSMSAAEKRLLRKLQAELAHSSEKLEEARGKLAAQRDASEKELASMARATEDAQRTADYNRKMENTKLEMKRGELTRAQEDAKRLEDAYEFVLEQLKIMLQSDDTTLGNLEESYLRLQETSSEPDIPVVNALDVSNATAKVEDMDAKIMEARNDVELLQQHTDLINRNIEATKEVLAIKHSELQECEFQWGMAKASVAHEESEMMVLEEETSVLSSLVLKLKGHLQHRVTRSLPDELMNVLDQRQIAALRTLLPTSARP